MARAREAALGEVVALATVLARVCASWMPIVPAPSEYVRFIAIRLRVRLSDAADADFEALLAAKGAWPCGSGWNSLRISSSEYLLCFGTSGTAAVLAPCAGQTPVKSLEVVLGSYLAG